MAQASFPTSLFFLAAYRKSAVSSVKKLLDHSTPPVSKREAECALTIAKTVNPDPLRRTYINPIESVLEEFIADRKIAANPMLPVLAQIVSQKLS